MMSIDWDEDLKKLNAEVAERAAAKKAVSDGITAAYQRDCNRGHGDWARSLPKGKYPVSASAWTGDDVDDAPSRLVELGAKIAAVRVDHFLLVIALAALSQVPAVIAAPEPPAAQAAASVRAAPVGSTPIALFPPDRGSSVTLAAMDVEARSYDTQEDEQEAKQRARLIFGVIVANSVFWQYLLPLVRGPPK